jgi:hypothetical protein
MIHQEDENLKKLTHVEIENSKLKDTLRKLRSELGSCEKIVVSVGLLRGGGWISNSLIIILFIQILY